MGEQSYFQRKFCASRFKRTKFGQSPAPPQTVQVANDRQHEMESGQTHLDRSTPGSANEKTNSCERLHETNGERPAGANQDSDSSRKQIPTSSTIATVTNESPASDQTGLPPVSDQLSARQTNDTTSHDHIETLDFHPDAQSLEPSESSESTSKHRAKQSKLLRATKAILMFRRATSSSLSQPDRSSNLRSSRSLVASFWSRQSAATLDGPNSAPRVHSVDSFGLDSQQRQSASSHSKPRGSSRTHSTLSAIFRGGNGDNNSSESTGGQRTRQQGPATSSSAFSLPRFIVPKINALKLPIVCLIKSLEDELMREIFIHRYELGQYLMDQLNVSLGMKDEKYFGLKMANSLDEQEDVRRPWLDLNESVYKQVSKLGTGNSLFSGPAKQQHQQQQQQDNHQHGQNIKSVSFYLRIKFYPPNLARVQDPFLKQYLWIQLRRDLRLGKLTSSQNNLTFLMACVLQYELGNHNSALVNEQLPQMNILPNQDLIERQAIEQWQEKLSGVKKHLALMQFLRASVILETYGFDYYPVRDHQRQRAFLLGFNYAGVKTIRNGRIANHFRWHNLSKISYERRMIIFHIYPNENSKRKQILGFKCLSNEECQNLYLRLLEQKYFFTVDLTYFDKSIRRPSLLNDGSQTRSIELLQEQQRRQQQQQQPQASLRPETDQAQEAAAAADYFSSLMAGIKNDDEEEDNDDDDDGIQQVDGRGANANDCELTNKRRFNYQHRADRSNNNSTLDSSFEHTQNSQATARCPSHPLNGCNDSCSQISLASSGCHQLPGRAPPPGLHAKSSSFHESDLPCSPSCCSQVPAPSSNRQQPVSNCFRRPDSALPPESNEHQPRAATAAAAATSHKQLHHLQRQSSFASYTPKPPQIETTSATGSQWAEQADSRQHSSLTPQNRDRLLDPGGLFLVSAHTNTEGHIVGSNTDIFLQGLRLCLIMLVLNIFLRLSDGLCGFLVELLSFRRHETTASSSVMGPDE